MTSDICLSCSSNGHYPWLHLDAFSFSYLLNQNVLFCMIGSLKHGLVSFPLMSGLMNVCMYTEMISMTLHTNCCLACSVSMSQHNNFLLCRLILGKRRPLVTGSEKHTVYIKNSIRFSYFGEKYHRNNLPKGICRYDFENETTWLCNIFTLGRSHKKKINQIFHPTIMTPK